LTKLIFYIHLVFILVSCSKDNGVYISTESPLKIPELFRDNILDPVIPIDNPQTIEGIALGKKLFFDPILSKGNNISCANCHSAKQAFSDSSRFSTGINNSLGDRNAMPLFNLAWHYDETFFWDGRSFSLENQAFLPVINSKEMGNDNWLIVEKRLQEHDEYPELFLNAFGSKTIDSTLAVKAIAQFERSLISSNSKFDNYLLGHTDLTTEELSGFNIFMNEAKGDCFHCHGSDKNPLWTDNDFHNNGLDSVFKDLGLGKITGDPADNGKFRTPSLRNLIFTAPYMHDGRFSTLEEVINHYSEGLKNSKTIDPLMKRVSEGGVRLTPKEKSDLKAFLLTLSDFSFINDE